MKRHMRKTILLAMLSGLLAFAPAQSITALAAGQSQTNSATDSKLSALDIAPGDLSPAFSPDTLTYTSTVAADVTSVQVQAVPRASGGSIASVSGAKGLKPGVNQITVVCSAPDQSYSTYTINLTVGEATGEISQTGEQTGTASENDASKAADSQTEGASQPADVSAEVSQSEAASEQAVQSSDGAEDESTGDAQAGAEDSGLVGSVSADGTVVLNGASYKLSNSFTYGSTSQDIPSAFGEGSVQIGDAEYKTMHLESGPVNLVYMENTDGNGSTGFYYYDEAANTVERFKYTSCGDNFVVLINTAKEAVPTGFVQTTYTLPSGKEVSAYQNTAEAMEEMYLIYGINSNGNSGWYLYDDSQGTYLRYVETAQVQAETEEEDQLERTVSLDKYNALYDSYSKLKSAQRLFVSIAAVGLVLLLMFFTALIMKLRDASEGGDEGQEPKQPKKKTARQNKRSKEAGKAQSKATGKKRPREVKKITGGEAVQADERAELTTEEKVVRAQEQMARALEQVNRTQEQIARTQESEARPDRDAMRTGERTSLTHLKQENPEEAMLRAQEKMRQSVQLASRRNPAPSGTHRQEQPAYQATSDVLRQQAAYHQSPEVQRQGHTAYQPMPGGQRQEQTAYQASSGGQGQEQISYQTEARESVFQPTKRIDLSEAEHDPMDEWEVKDSSRRLQKRRAPRVEDEVEIMDLNDL